MTPQERAERERRWAEHEERLRASECAALAVHWDGAYTFGHDGKAYVAPRSDSGATVSDPDLYEFRELVRLDYFHKPVPRDRTRD